jgi:hypothetical protein
MPDRILRERITTSPELDSVSPEAERLFLRQMVRCDDYGGFEADPSIMLAMCFPRRAGAWKPATVAGWRDELARAGVWTLFTIDGRLFGSFVSWSRHQRKRTSRPKFPSPADPRALLVAGPASCGISPPRVESREARVESCAGAASRGGAIALDPNDCQGSAEHSEAEPESPERIRELIAGLKTKWTMTVPADWTRPGRRTSEVTR